MKKNLIICAVFVVIIGLVLSLSVYGMKISTKKENPNNVETSNEQPEISGDIISNDLFSITLPKEVNGTYILENENNGINIYDKASSDAGFGGFAFGLKAFKNPKDYASAPGVRKLGELTDKNGVIYDIALIQPTDVQFDYVNKNDKTYSVLYKLADSAENNILGVNGSKYYNGRGMKGKELYNDILKLHVKAVKEKWNEEKLLTEKMSTVYSYINQNNDNTPDIIGYAYHDANADGIDELLIGKIAKNEKEATIYDIYTMVDRKPTHVISSNNNNGYYVCDDSFICEEYFMRGNENGVIVYFLEENSTELFPQVGFKYSEIEGKQNPWFLCYDPELKNWENVSEKTFKERKAIFDKYSKIEFIPLRKLMK